MQQFTNHTFTEYLPDMVLFAQKVLFSTVLLSALLSHSNLANKLKH